MSQGRKTTTQPRTPQSSLKEERPRSKAGGTGPSRVSIALTPSKASVGPRRSTYGLRTSFMPVRTSRAHPSTDFEALVSKMSGDEPANDVTDFKTLIDYFMGFWKAPHAASALAHLEKMETKRTVRALQKRHGFWQPPAEVAEVLKRTSPTAVSNLPDNKDGRNLKFILKMLGCSLHENKPYKQFLKAKTLRQKRNWLYKYQRPSYNPSPMYIEPVCPTRLRRLHNFFPDRFTEMNGFMYFNDKMLSFDELKNVFYIGKELGN